MLYVEIQIFSSIISVSFISINNNHHSVSIYRAGGSSRASDFELPAPSLIWTGGYYHRIFANLTTECVYMIFLISTMNLVIENPLLKRIKKIKLFN